MKSREEILKNQLNTYDEPNVFHMDSRSAEFIQVTDGIYESMDTWAKQEAFEFLNWVNSNGLRMIVDGWLIGDEFYTNSDIKVWNDFQKRENLIL